MTDMEFKELIRILTQPHRVQNVFALFKHCEEAATLLQQQKAELEKLRLASPKTNNPKEMIEKLQKEWDEKMQKQKLQAQKKSELGTKKGAS